MRSAHDGDPVRGRSRYNKTGAGGRKPWKQQNPSRRELHGDGLGALFGQPVVSRLAQAMVLTT